MKLEKAIRIFMEDMVARGVSEDHMKRRRFGLETLLRNGGFKGRMMHTISAVELNSWLKSLRKNNGNRYKDASLAGISESYRALWKFGCDQMERVRGRRLPWCRPMGGIERFKFHTNEDKTVAPADVTKVLRSLEQFAYHRGGNPRDLRDALIVSMALESGKRIGELQQVTRADMHRAIARGSVQVVEVNGVDVQVSVYSITTTGKTKEVPLIFHDLSARLFQEYVDKLPPRKILSKSNWLFVNGRTGLQLGKRAMSSAFERLCEFAEVPLFYSHSARHTLVTELDDLGVNTGTIQAVTGHSSEKMINEHYLNRKVSKAKRAGAILQAHRLAKVEQENVSQVINRLFKPAT